MSWEEKAEKVKRDSGKQMQVVEKLVKILIHSDQSRQGKYMSLRKLVDTAAELVAPHTPCRKGCSYCCWMAVPLSRHEAEVLAKATGKKIRDQPYVPANIMPEATSNRLDHNAVKFVNTPCPFLSADGECTVYDSRPIVCRTHHVIEDTPENCDTFSGLKDAMQVDLGFGTYVVTTLFKHQQFADIREWFDDKE